MEIISLDSIKLRKVCPKMKIWKSGIIPLRVAFGGVGLDAISRRMRWLFCSRVDIGYGGWSTNFTDSGFALWWAGRVRKSCWILLRGITSTIVGALPICRLARSKTLMAFHNTRENESGMDLNREIDGDKVELVAGVIIFLRDRRFDFSIYFHEDWEVSEFYLYEPSAMKNGLVQRL